MESIYCAVRTDSLYKVDYVSSLKGCVAALLRSAASSRGCLLARTCYLFRHAQCHSHCLHVRTRHSNTNQLTSCTHDLSQGYKFSIDYICYMTVCTCQYLSYDLSNCTDRYAPPTQVTARPVKCGNTSTSLDLITKETVAIADSCVTFTERRLIFTSTSFPRIGKHPQFTSVCQIYRLKDGGRLKYFVEKIHRAVRKKLVSTALEVTEMSD
jgi:hypothetical protein